MNNETPAEVLADMRQLEEAEAPMFADVLRDLRTRLERSLAAGKVVKSDDDASAYLSNLLMEFADMAAAWPHAMVYAPPADPAKASAPDYDRSLIADMLESANGLRDELYSHDAIIEQISLLRAADNADAAKVRTAKASGSAPDGWTEDRLRAEAKARGWYTREGASVPSADEDWRHPFEVTIPSRDLCALLASAPEVTESMVERAILATGAEIWTEAYEEQMRAALTAALQQEGKSHDQ